MLTPLGYDPCDEGLVNLTPSQIAQIIWEYADRSLSAAPGGAVGPDALNTDADIYLTALVGGTARCCAKVVLWNGICARVADIVDGDLQRISLGREWPSQGGKRTDRDLSRAGRVSVDSLQSDALASGYNFMHVLDVSTHPAFAAGRRIPGRVPTDARSRANHLGKVPHQCDLASS